MKKKTFSHYLIKIKSSRDYLTRTLIVAKLNLNLYTPAWWPKTASVYIMQKTLVKIMLKISIAIVECYLLRLKMFLKVDLHVYMKGYYS